MQLNAAEQGFLGRGDLPLIALLSALARWWEDRHFELMAEQGFDDVRRAHNAVFVNLRADGMRLTDLAEVAGISKQAMAELVDDLVQRRYLLRSPDPTDGRAKIITWAKRGKAAHQLTLEVFARIEAEMAAKVGEQAMSDMKGSLETLFFSLVVGRDATT